MTGRRQDGEDDTDRPRSSECTWDDEQGYPETTPPYALRQTLSHLAMARQLIRRTIASDDVDLEPATGIIDQALAALCPHGPVMHRRSIADSGEELVTWLPCDVS